MPGLERAKRLVETITGWSTPKRDELAKLVRRRKANLFCFRDDGVIPNHPNWPLIVYRGAFARPDRFDPAAILEQVFDANGWGDSWRNGIYDYVHYHSRIHEALGVARGAAKVRFGGRRGRSLTLKAGDVAVLPAGTGHECLEPSDDFLVVGAYPPFGVYDECRTSEDRKAAMAAIPKVRPPSNDPVYGASGPLRKLWRSPKD